MIKEMIFAGFGGQGVLTAGVIMGQIGLKAGKKISWIPSYGAEMRGGTANCMVKIADGNIGSPYTAAPDVLVAMNDPAIAKFQKTIKPGGTMFVNESLCKTQEFREDITVVKVAANDIAKEHGNPRGANVVFIGAVLGMDVEYELDFVKGCLVDYFEGKKAEVIQMNEKLVEQGYAITV